ncbi:MAG: GntR family transcriptional regulator [Rhodobiaceae bacterium]|nr:GntR family transcriptional regulator [Rhodobiaceae bacterium]MCC0048583.1 GntR family transcriptional regulator [Rhodobiaceae bacterium]
MHALAGDERIPIYQRLADTLRQSVITGALKPGDRAPSENFLSDEYGLAPGTVRKALDVLVGEGVFERFQGKGTFVRRPSFDASLFRFFRFRGPDGEFRVPESRILRREIEPMPGHVCVALEVSKGTPGISMSRLRMHEGTPVVAEEIWLEHAPFAKFADMPAEEIGALLYPVYDRECGRLVARAEETMTVEAASREIARLLRIDAGAPVIVIDRIAKGYDNKPIEWRRSRGRADQFTYQTEIR